MNDFFEIEDAQYYPGILVEVYTRWGEKIFSSTGYSDDQRWDGTYNGKDVPLGTYYFIIVPYIGAEARTGPVTIVR
jgi:gliding motility-associated-like protein